MLFFQFTFLPEHGTLPQVVFVYGEDIGSTYIDVTPLVTNSTKNATQDIERFVVMS